MKRPLLTSVVLSGMLLATAACGGSDAGAGGGDKTEVTASFYPMAWLAERVGGAHVTVTTLTSPGVEPHDLELSPRQIGALSETDLTLYVGDLQPAVDDAVAQHAADRALDAATLVDLLPSDGHAHEDEHEDEHADEPEGAEEHGHEGEHDPHFWTDPSRMATVATALGERLAKADPANAADYKAAAKTTADELTALDGEFKDGLATCENRTIVTGHTAFSYLADRYDLKQVGVSGLDPEAEPSPRRLAELVELVKSNGVTTVFTETLASPKVAQTLADSAGVKTAVLDPVEGVAQGSSDDYMSLQRANLATLRTALSCS
ncbi:metal ABC transporter substrate-binding protein [Actinocorallia sp. A-T 12471]|uniref:metal ABC transporter substrate-binding protein n=1 Tax=Actinocorallia sp. A-T 12471 TaxID=3089813 RepID=UPI0029D1F12C|nr:metal ABC transporter substrate-binding protein [Actinocorallia sp. A-T 12471]MDX6744676.1 metal ABC transporter substrate-binding protein [Actinocorallia sp. A-T 12471]